MAISNVQVEVQESDHIKICRFLREKNLVPANSLGDALSNIGEDREGRVGVLRPFATPPNRSQIFWGSIFPSLRPRREFIGIIWYHNPTRKAGSGRWVFEVYGRMNLGKVTELGRDLQQAFDVEVSVTLTDESPHQEFFFSDL